MVFFNELFQTVRLSKWYLHFDTPSFRLLRKKLGLLGKHPILSVFFYFISSLPLCEKMFALNKTILAYLSEKKSQPRLYVCTLIPCAEGR